MEGSKRNRKWPLAILAAVAFPVLALHSTCIAVLGPGSWGSGMVETLPEFKAPTPAVEAFAREFAAQQDGEGISADQVPPEVAGSIKWGHAMGERALYLTQESREPRQRLYVSDGGEAIREVPLPEGHHVARPQWTSQGLAYVRWNPWAVPTASKLWRYVASWLDPSLRPEASIYVQDEVSGGWRYLMPGHTLAVSPDGRRAALLRSGAQLAGYYSIHILDVGSSEAPAILSLREHGDKATGSFRMRWSADSVALHIQGRTGGFNRRSSERGPDAEGIPIDLVYLPVNDTVYDLNLGS